LEYSFPFYSIFCLFIAKYVLARKTANNLSSYDLAFISAALIQDRTYNLGALISFRLATNHEDGEETGDNSVQPSNPWEFPYQQSYFDYGLSASSSREPDYDHANDDPPAWGDYRSWD
jgi:hypothetical protein